MDMNYLMRFIPCGELAVIMDNPAVFSDILDRVERQLRSLPRPEQCWGRNPDEILIRAHYFSYASDWWLYALEDNLEYAQAFVCLNGDDWNAECGPVYIPEFLPIRQIELDLHWDDATTLKEVMDRMRGGE